MTQLLDELCSAQPCLEEVIYETVLREENMAKGDCTALGRPEGGGGHGRERTSAARVGSEAWWGRRTEPAGCSRVC